MNTRLIATYSTLLVILILIGGCKKDNFDADPEPSDIVAIAQNDGELHLFAEAIMKTDLRKDLLYSNHTAFAPQDEVFQKYLDDLGVYTIDSWINTYGLSLVRNIMRYHLIQGPEIQAQQFGNTYVSTEAKNKQGDKISMHTLRMDTIIRLNGKALVTQMNIKASRGIIHKIDMVLSLPTIPSLIEANPNFSLLKDCFQAANGNLNTLLRQENEEYTVFAPTNAGFLDYFNNSGYFNDYTSFLQYNSAGTVRDILLYHTLDKAIRSDQLQNRTYSTALPGFSFDVSKDSHGNISITDLKGNKADVVFSNITALNGVIHSMDYVLMFQ